MANDHYVSQFYLRGFWFRSKNSKKPNKVYTYKIENKICESDWEQIEKIACQNNLFDVNIEAKFGPFELQMSRLIKKIEAEIRSLKATKKFCFQLTEKDRLDLIKFIEFQIKRPIVVHPQFKERIKKEKLTIVSNLLPIAKNFFWNAGLENIENHPDFTAVEYHAIQYVSSHFNEDTINILSKNGDCYIYFINTSKPRAFITSDFPVYMKDSWGFKPEITLPLTNKIILLITRGNWKLYFTEIKEWKWVRDKNQRTIANATQIYWNSFQLVKSLWDNHKNSILKYPLNNLL